ncbi:MULTISPECIES: hypothetical protein [unclassified Streptomyces]|uniref:hypothetical protein n=1 Tax=unclassified Streptomyces TaxID=2593676 RepID=UPI002E2B481B|nr:hypothetical protein [Streptomyces sp. NBC_00223]
MTTPNTPDDAHGMDKQNPVDSRSDAAPLDGPAPGDATSGDAMPGDHTPGDGAGAPGSAEARGSRADGQDPGDPVIPAGPVDADDFADLDDAYAAGLYGESAEEAALRSLMRDAVQGIQASPTALDHLRHAIPLRRQRRKQALLGTAAALLLAGMAIPAVIRAAGSPGQTTAAPVNVASSHATRPGEDGHTGPWGDSGAPSGSTSTPEAGAVPTVTGDISGPTGTPTTLPDTPPPVPDCSSAQLGQGASRAAAPDSGGRIYGWFRVANVSDTPCTVPSGGVVQAVALGAADQSRIQVVGHVAGDPAAGLPPSATESPVLLSPGQEYEVDWAWVPAQAGPGGCPVPTSPPASATPTTTATATGGTDQDGTDPGSVTGADTPQSGGATSPPPQPPSVALNHTPAAGAPEVVGPVIEDACAGTVYTAAPMAASNSTPRP